MQGVGQSLEQVQNGLLPGAALGFFPGTGFAPLLRLGQILKALLLHETSDAFRAGLEIQPERPLHGDLAKAEPGGGEDPADGALLVLAVLGEHAGLAVPAVGQEFQHVRRLVRGNLVPLVP